jgi:hypothetical protein
MRFFLKGWLITVAISYAIFSLTACDCEPDAFQNPPGMTQEQVNQIVESGKQRFKVALADKATSLSQDVEESSQVLCGAKFELDKARAAVTTAEQKQHLAKQRLARLEEFAKKPLPTTREGLHAANKELSKL